MPFFKCFLEPLVIFNPILLVYLLLLPYLISLRDTVSEVQLLTYQW